MPILQVNAADYGMLSRALKQSAPEIRKAMNREIGAAARPIVKRARDNILGASGIPTPFKTAAAKRVRLVNDTRVDRVQVGIVAPSASADFPDAHRRLNRVGAFRHPVYGNRKVWVEQRGPQSWFDEPFMQAQAQLRSAVERAMQDAVDALERKAGR